jgi:phosphohistidine phosphatase
MKTLTLLRHAKSDSDDAALRDFDRGLNAKGRRAARTMGRHLRQPSPLFDRVYASPARRVVETADEFAAGLEQQLSPLFERELYLASVEVLLDRVRSADPEADRILLIGHNPGLERLVLLLVPEAQGDAARGDVALKYPTASLAELTLPIARWGECGPGQASLSRFIRPRDLDPSLGPDEPA